MSRARCPSRREPSEEHPGGRLRDLGIEAVEYVLCLNSTDQHWAAMAEVVAPQGHIRSIVETAAPVDLGVLMAKSASFSWS